MIYFIQCAATGSIKAGKVRGDIAPRKSILDEWTPAGSALLAMIPGDMCREQALHWALAPQRLRREWYRPTPTMFRVVLEAIDEGDLWWLPRDHDVDGGQAPIWKAAVEYFGNKKAVCEALGLSDAANHMMGTNPSASFWGRFEMEKAIRAGRVPPHIGPDQTRIPNSRRRFMFAEAA